MAARTSAVAHGAAAALPLSAGGPPTFASRSGGVTALRVEVARPCCSSPGICSPLVAACASARGSRRCCCAAFLRRRPADFRLTQRRRDGTASGGRTSVLQFTWNMLTHACSTCQVLLASARSLGTYDISCHYCSDISSEFSCSSPNSYKRLYDAINATIVAAAKKIHVTTHDYAQLEKETQVGSSSKLTIKIRSSQPRLFLRVGTYQVPTYS